MMNVLMLVVATGITLWMAGAIYYDVLNAAPWAGMLASLWCGVVGLLMLCWQPMWQPFFLLLWGFAIFVGWWLTLKPSNDRVWDANSAVLPRAKLEGDVIKFENIRNSTYRSKTDFTPSYYDKQFHLSNLVAVDLLLYYWGSPWLSHPTLIFDFGAEGRVGISIEVRYRQGQVYDIVRSIYRQQELIYLVCDELDAILQETEFAPSAAETYLYRIQADATETRIALLDYASQIESLAENPRWYNSVTANCTTSIFRHPHNHAEWDWRMLLNGWLDRCLYDRGRLDRSVPFEQLRKSSRINELVDKAARERLGDTIRERLWGTDASAVELDSTDDGV